MMTVDLSRVRFRGKKKIRERERGGMVSEVPYECIITPNYNSSMRGKGS